ncbi:hypothetical protein [Polyangium sp. 15x6]|uniref:hypothetical protein n=1 Tax=Polyangium sp. 15x6 TaxID=3042687 RepID=UPI00249AFCF1|nr:hypothetical protein [Polyangium sp. 15x6]MDI3285114.1 hypothetical protein [Polyangium sp. 15x6]
MRDKHSTRTKWAELCRSNEFSGRWVALENVEYKPGRSEPHEGDVVDRDSDIGQLCSRMRESERNQCVILHCGDADGEP